jgi:DNA-binding NarL/FixJ family response regulator
MRMPASILLVDDDPVFRGLTRRVLAASGLEVAAEAGTVAEALAHAREAPPEAAVIDIGLPDGSGIVLATELAALPSPPRVVLVSTDPDAATPDDVRRSGAGAFIAKQDLPNAPLRDLLAGA